MKESGDYVKEQTRRRATSIMMWGGWLGIQGYVAWSLVTVLTAGVPTPPGALPLWTGPIAFDLFLFAVVGTMLRSRMRLRDTIVGVFVSGIRAARARGVDVAMQDGAHNGVSFMPLNDEKPPTEKAGG